jgi:hypothetical protein
MRARTTRLLQQASHSSRPHTLQDFVVINNEAAKISSPKHKFYGSSGGGPAVVPAIEKGKLGQTHET